MHFTPQLAGATLVLCLIVYVTRLTRKSTSSLPGPWISKWTSLVLTYYWLKGQRCQYVHRLHDTYGPVVRIAPNEVDILDGSSAKEIYSTKEIFLKTTFYINVTGGVVRNVFNTSDIEYHKRLRRLLSAGMAESSLIHMLPVIQRNALLTIQGMKAEAEKRGAFDAFKWWLFMATDIIGELSFGESFRMLEKGEKNQYARDLEGLSKAGLIRATFPTLITIARRLPLPIPIIRRTAEAGKRFLRYGHESIQLYRAAAEEDPVHVKPTLFTKLYKAEDDDALTMVELRDTAQAYIVAGSDTTATTLTYLTWAVCRRPGIKMKLVEELATLPEGFGHNDLKALPYLNQTIEEALRLYAAAPAGLPRYVPPRGAELAGHWFEEGTVVCCQAYSLHRDPKVFPRPEEFDPSRWANPSKEMKDSFLAFGNGARVCLGIHLARMELRLGVALFFRAFPHAIISEREGMSDEDMDMEISFLLSPKGHRCLVQIDQGAEKG